MRTNRRRAARLAALAVTAVGLTVMWAGLAGATVDPDTNKVSYWCPNGGVKYEPVSTPFVVPSPPDGFTWTLLVLKAGADESADPVNETFADPVVGQAYSRTDGKSISHAILCQSPVSTTTTTGSTTTGGSTTTTGSTTTGGSTTTEATTTTTIATTTTGPTSTTAPTTTVNCGLCAGQSESTTTTTTTPTTVPATTSPPTTAATTTLPASTVAATVVPAAPAPTSLPVTGSTDGPLLAVGLGLVGSGGLALVASRRRTA